MKGDEMGVSYVYILSNTSRTLYIGMTNNLEIRMDAHRRKLNPGFSRDYNLSMLVLVEEYANPTDAIAREKQVKNWSRVKKVRLIEAQNPDWRDLSRDWVSGDAALNRYG